GGGARDDGTSITLQPYTFIQAGIVCTQDAVSTLAAPSGPGPWFVIVSVIDDDPVSGVLLQATNNASQIGSAVVVAYKANGGWYNPISISVAGVQRADAPEKGRESGFLTTAVTAAGLVTAFQIDRGRAIDANGDRREIGGGRGAAIQ